MSFLSPAPACLEAPQPVVIAAPFTFGAKLSFTLCFYAFRHAPVSAPCIAVETGTVAFGDRRGVPRAGRHQRCRDRLNFPAVPVSSSTLPASAAVAQATALDPFVPEISYVATPRVACDGASQTHPALGHPRVYMQIDEKGYVDCGYCDRRFILKGGAADVPGEPAQA